jgi:hypothetical protein
MSDYETDRESELDFAEQEALSALLAVPELSAGEWNELRGSIERACELPLAQRRKSGRPSRARVITWLWPALPMAAAAVLLIMLRTPSREVGNGKRPSATELTTAEQVLLMDVSDTEFTQLVAGAADAEALLRMAVREE